MGYDWRTCFKRRVCTQDFYETATGNAWKWSGLGRPPRKGNVCFSKWSRSKNECGSPKNDSETENIRIIITKSALHIITYNFALVALKNEMIKLLVKVSSSSTKYFRREAIYVLIPI